MCTNQLAVHLNYLGDNVYDSQNNNVTVRFADGKTLSCNKSALADVSEYFRALFFGNFQENGNSNVKLPDVDYDVFNKVLVACTNGESSIVRLSCEEIWEVIELSDMLAFKTSAEACDKILSARLNADNCVAMCGLADSFHRLDLIKDAVHFMLDTWFGEHITNLKNFKTLKTDSIYTCSNCDKNTEHSLLIKRIFNTNISNKFTNNETLGPVFEQSGSLENLLDCYKIEHRFYFIGGFRYRTHYKCYKMESDLFVGQKQTVEREEEDLNSGYSNLPEFPDRNLEDYRTVAVGRFIYVIGGFNYEKMQSTRATWRLCTRENRWSQVAPMKHGRLMHCATTVGGRVYVCGGYDGETVHSTAECYDTRINKWIALPNMPIGVGNAACTSHDVSIYVICGQFGVKSIQTTSKVQQFNTTSRQWSLPTIYDSPVFSPLSEYGMSAVGFEDDIIVLGGQTTRVDAFNTKTLKWKRLADMNSRRMDVTCMKYRGQVLAAGGWDYSSGEYFGSVEVYNSVLNTWKVLPHSLPVAAKNIGFCYVYDVERK
uniref:kelch-like protein 23 isoform X2 n=1 Tax=Ciona intestinalis TaxID=7719 RepID=UPI00089DBDD9|nr:kelch-like protein 23 isoform X2 [Ciona intestinalis]|eukprot:XP_018667486.1 kelch-like protein 23 isoform X2 [Ciona intestinalis]